MKKLAVIVLVCAAVYAIAGFLILPKIIERGIKTYVTDSAGRSLSIEAVKVNPFTLTVELRGMSLAEADAAPSLAIEKAVAKFRIIGLVAVEAAVGISGFDVTALGSSASVLPEVEIKSGSLIADVRVRRANDKTRVEGEITLRQVEIIDKTSQALIFAADEVAGSGLSIDTSPPRARLGLAQLTNPTLEVTLNPDLSPSSLQWLRAWTRNSASFAPSIDRIEFSGGRIDFADPGVSPPLHVVANDVSGAIVKNGEDDQARATVLLEGRVNELGSGTLTGSFRLRKPRRESELNLVLRNLKASLLSPYSARLLGRHIDSGRLYLNLRWLVRNNEFEVDNNVILDALRLGKPVEHPNAVELPLDLAAALFTDPDQHINVTIPVPGGPLDADFDIAALVHKCVRDFVTSVTDAPFETLGALVEAADEALQTVEFEPGSAAIAAPASEKLNVLHTALELRPALDLYVTPRYHAVADRYALARQQMHLHIALATGAAAAGQARGLVSGGASAPDFSDPKVQSVVDEFATSRLSPKMLARIRARYAAKSEGYYASAFEALVANEKVSNTALKTLARYRAQSIVDELTKVGADAKRLRIADRVETADHRSDELVVELSLQANGTAQSREDEGSH